MKYDYDHYSDASTLEFIDRVPNVGVADVSRAE